MVHGSWKQYRIIVFCMWVVHPLWQLQIEKWMVFYYFDRNYTACTITIYFTCPASEHLVTFALLKPISSNHTHILLSKQLSKRKQNKARTYKANTNITLRTFNKIKRECLSPAHSKFSNWNFLFLMDEAREERQQRIQYSGWG